MTAPPHFCKMWPPRLRLVPVASKSRASSLLEPKTRASLLWLLYLSESTGIGYGSSRKYSTQLPFVCTAVLHNHSRGLFTRQRHACFNNRDLEELLPRTHNIVSRKQYSYPQILAYSGPGSLPELDSLVTLGDEALLEVLRACRRKLSSDPKDKVFGILGVLGKEVRDEFAVDYGKSVKEVFTDVVDFLLTTTDDLNVICEAIHFPVYTSSANLPTWVPDWSYVPATSAISLSPGTKFAASRNEKANFELLRGRRNQLEISAVPLGSISWHGITVGTLCTLGDYLMAFLNWRALLIRDMVPKASKDRLSFSVQEEFCETICFRQIPLRWKDRGP